VEQTELQQLETPRMLYKVGSQCELESGKYDLLVVKDQDELEQALAGDWHLDQYAAKAAHEAALIASVKSEQFVKVEQTQPADDTNKPPTREELKQKATELGLNFHHNTGDDKLAAMIADALKAKGE
jgi:hypothetical protein